MDGIRWWVKMLMALPVIGVACLTFVGRLPAPLLAALVGLVVLVTFALALREGVFRTACDYATAAMASSAGTEPRDDQEAHAHRDRLVELVADFGACNLIDIARLHGMPKVAQLAEHIGDTDWGRRLSATIAGAHDAIELEAGLCQRVSDVLAAQPRLRKAGADVHYVVVQWITYLAQADPAISFHTELESDGRHHVYLSGRPSVALAAGSVQRVTQVRRFYTRLYRTIAEWPEWADARSRRRAAMTAWSALLDDRPDGDVLRNQLRHGECVACRRVLPALVA